jgi:hypothetical protein
MASRVDSKRLIEGWTSRLGLGLDSLKNVGGPKSNFLPDDCVSKAALLATNSDVRLAVPMNLHVARVVLSFRTVNEQLNFIGQFDNSVTKLTAALTVGSIFSRPKAALKGIPSEDYSLVCMSELLDDEEQDELWASLKLSIGCFLDNLQITRADGLVSLRSYAEVFGVKVSSAESLRDLSGIALKLKQSRWAIFGSDILSLIQALCDPLHQLTIQQISAGFKLASAWRMDALIAALVLTRAFGGFQSEKQYYVAHASSFSSVGRSTLRIADYVLTTKADEHVGLIPPFLKGFAQNDVVSQLLHLTANVALATKRKQLPILKAQILAMYNVDQLAPYLLDWHSIHISFPLPASEADLASIFLKSIMSSTIVGKRFFSVALARGKGQLVADLSSYVSRLRSGRDTQGELGTRSASSRSRTKGTYDFVRGMRTLPPRVRNSLMEEVLEKGMMERLAFAFPTSISLPDAGVTRTDNQASRLRIELANLARRETVLTERNAFRIIDEETQHLRMLKFHTFFKSGRVRVDWDHLIYSLANYIDRRFDVLQSTDSAGAIHTLVHKNVVDLISQEITSALLFDSEASLTIPRRRGLRGFVGARAGRKYQPPTSPLMTLPNSTHRSPLNTINCSWLIGAKLVGEVLIRIPGNSTSVRKSFKLAACFMMFSRVRSSPHCLSTWTRVCATA